MFAGKDYNGMSIADVSDHFVNDWRADSGALEKYEILAISGELGGYEEWAWFLLRDKETGDLLEGAGSHCSCYGYEDQFEPKPTTRKYLLSDKFWASGVDSDKFQEWFLEYSDKMNELSLADTSCAK